MVVPDSPSSFIHASQAVFIAIQVLTSLGYFLNLSKFVLVPMQWLIFLGLMCDSILLTFLLPQDKIEKFAALRESILSQKWVTIVCLQKLVGKCVSFSLVIMAAKLFTHKTSIAVSRAMKSQRLVKICGPLREEIQYWRFLDECSGHMTWRDERHVTVSIASDASSSGETVARDCGAVTYAFGFGGPHA